MKYMKNIIPFYYLIKDRNLKLPFYIYSNLKTLLTFCIFIIIFTGIPMLLINKNKKTIIEIDFYFILYLVLILVNCIYFYWTKDDKNYISEKNYNVKNNSLNIDMYLKRLTFINKDTNELIKININDLITKDGKIGEFAIKELYSENKLENIKIKIKSNVFYKQEKKYYIKYIVEILKSQEN